MSNEQVRTIEEDEIDLRELWQIVMKRKVLIIALTLVVTAGAIIWAFTSTPIYEAKALIRIGSYQLDNNNNNNKAVLCDAIKLTKELNIFYVDMFKNVKDRKANVDSIIVPKGLNEFIEIKSLSISNDLAKKEIEKIVEYIQVEHRKILDDVKQRREINIKNLDTKINNIKDRDIPLLLNKIKIKAEALNDFEKQIKTINNNLKNIQGSNPSLAALKLIEKRDLTTYIINLKSDLIDMEEKKYQLSTTEVDMLKENKLLISALMLPHNYKNTQIIGEIITSDYPIKPKKKLIVVVAFVTGLVLSIFMAFLLNFIANTREENK
ncbi:LPS O-antigen chain length determinant protein, WzzB/FepE family [Epsilonproteobacteria bacterium SCGC AD-311-C15]|jgi:LPS O-antigen subunit length determinant protein (WzzB/FepE family)|nr:LPS O-antigen chain length determinant protein, WzzB/FepE family [Epsilonproteobacteria bacterium SCGC AD-311-C15]